MELMENLEQILISKYPELVKAKEYGIDIVALFDNINRTPTERIRRLQIAVDTIRQLRSRQRMQ
jgi:hypothetical protein